MTSDQIQPRGDGRSNRMRRSSALLLAPRDWRVVGGLSRAAPIAAGLWLALAVVALIT